MFHAIGGRRVGSPPEPRGTVKGMKRPGERAQRATAWFEQHLGEWVSKKDFAKALGIGREHVEMVLMDIDDYRLQFYIAETIVARQVYYMAIKKDRKT